MTEATTRPARVNRKRCFRHVGVIGFHAMSIVSPKFPKLRTPSAPGEDFTDEPSF